jgi:hypothetical protein
MDWERVKFFAQAIVDRVPRTELEQMHYFKITSDELAYAEAATDPVGYAMGETESEVAGACRPPQDWIDYFNARDEA